jgi:hypothetical protein
MRSKGKTSEILDWQSKKIEGTRKKFEEKHKRDKISEKGMNRKDRYNSLKKIKKESRWY